ncbi:MAG: hypothetical protein AB1491_13020 [Thermodesulfobacteriota bacterium]
MAVYLILGAGKFGRLAQKRLPQQDASAHLVVVEQDPQALKEAQSLSLGRVTWVAAEALAYLRENLTDSPPWDWLIPMVPIHVAYVWLTEALREEGDWETLKVPGEVGNLVPTVHRGPQGELYLSRATHLCPDDCAEPEVCPVSGEARDRALYEELAELALPDCRLLIIPSRQLAPGVGGYSPRELLHLKQALSGYQGKALIATACRCHGVAHLIRRRARER